MGTDLRFRSYLRMAAVHHYEMCGIPAKCRDESRLVPWIKDLGAAFGLIAFIASSFAILDGISAFFS
jgi:hypothetical protein